MKRPYLVLYDYGTGGVWSYLMAESAEQILGKFPALEIYDETPAWMSDAERHDIKARSTYDIDSAEDDDPEFFGRIIRRSRPDG